MTTLSKRSTIYLDPALHQALRLKALETSRSMSEIINEAVKEHLLRTQRISLLLMKGLMNL